MEWIRSWWRQPDRSDQLFGHLSDRGTLGAARTAVATSAVLMSLVALSTIWASTGPRGPVPVSLALCAAAGGFVAAAMCATPEPAYVQSVRFILVSAVSLTLGTLAQSEPLAGVLSSTVFVTVTGYVAVVHAAPLLVFCFVLAEGTALVEVARCAVRYGLIEAFIAGASTTVVIVLVPLAIHSSIKVFGMDALAADRDQLTGLLNRGAFHRRAVTYLDGSDDLLPQVTVTVIDLDRFKQLNDRYGHRTGDETLAAVAAALRANTKDTAIIGRIGGEEFAVVDLWEPGEAAHRAQMLCDAIAALPFDVTGSIGIAAWTPDRQRHHETIVELIDAADAAMYSAKRRGGNQVCAAAAPTAQ